MSDPRRIVVPGNAHVFLAPLGTAAPADAYTPMPTSWVDVGLTTEDSLQFIENPTFGQVRSHQSNYVTRIYQQADEGRVEVDLQEFSGQSMLNVFGGGTLTQVTAPTVGPPATPGTYRYAPPAVGGRSNVACVAEGIDGDKHYRFVVPNAFNDSGVTMKLQKRAEVTLPLRLMVLGSDGVDPWYMLTDDDAWAPI